MWKPVKYLPTNVLGLCRCSYQQVSSIYLSRPPRQRAFISSASILRELIAFPRVCRRFGMQMEAGIPLGQGGGVLRALSNSWLCSSSSVDGHPRDSLKAIGPASRRINFTLSKSRCSTDDNYSDFRPINVHDSKNNCPQKCQALRQSIGE